LGWGEGGGDNRHPPSGPLSGVVLPGSHIEGQMVKRRFFVCPVALLLLVPRLCSRGGGSVLQPKATPAIRTGKAVMEGDISILFSWTEWRPAPAMHACLLLVTEVLVSLRQVTMSASSYLRDLEKNFYGAASAYDTAVAPSAARSELPQALWR
jgi:hypothetical protein